MQRAALAEVFEDQPDETALHHDHRDAVNRQRCANDPGRPAKGARREIGPDRGVDVVGGVIEKGDREQPSRAVETADLHQAAQGVCTGPLEASAFVHSQAFGDKRKPDQEVKRGQAGCGIERRARSDLAQKAADDRAKDEAEAESRRGQTEILRAFFGR